MTAPDRQTSTDTLKQLMCLCASGEPIGGIAVAPLDSVFSRAIG